MDYCVYNWTQPKKNSIFFLIFFFLLHSTLFLPFCSPHLNVCILTQRVLCVPVREQTLLPNIKSHWKEKKYEKIERTEERRTRLKNMHVWIGFYGRFHSILPFVYTQTVHFRKSEQKIKWMMDHIWRKELREWKKKKKRKEWKRKLWRKTKINNITQQKWYLW